MSYAALRVEQYPFPTYLGPLFGVIEQLRGVMDHMLSVGLEAEAGSLETVIADLRWQCDQLVQGEPAVAQAIHVYRRHRNRRPDRT
jgi:hypothetical protein